MREVEQKMRKKTIGILVCTLLIATAAYPVVGLMNDKATQQTI